MILRAVRVAHDAMRLFSSRFNIALFFFAVVQRRRDLDLYGDRRGWLRCPQLRDVGTLAELCYICFMVSSVTRRGYVGRALLCLFHGVLSYETWVRW